MARKTVAALVGVEAAWELASESYVVAHVGARAYHRTYAIPSPNLALFWLGGAMATIVAVLVVTRAGRRPAHEGT